MAMGMRKDRERQEALWVVYAAMAVRPGPPFYVGLNEVLDDQGFDAFAEKLCAPFHAEKMGRSGLTPGIYFRSPMIGYFEGIESERGIAWRLKDSLSPRRFLGIALDEDTPDHSTIARARRLIDVETHKQAPLEGQAGPTAGGLRTQRSQTLAGTARRTNTADAGHLSGRCAVQFAAHVRGGSGSGRRLLVCMQARQPQDALRVFARRRFESFLRRQRVWQLLSDRRGSRASRSF